MRRDEGAAVECPDDEGVEIRDLDALEEACRRLGLELVRGQTTFKRCGHRGGEYTMPAGFTTADLGRCDHAIRIPGNGRAYEVGVLSRRDGTPGFLLMWDNWAPGGHGLERAIGHQGERIMREHAATVRRRRARRNAMLHPSTN